MSLKQITWIGAFVAIPGIIISIMIALLSSEMRYFVIPSASIAIVFFSLLLLKNAHDHDDNGERKYLFQVLRGRFGRFLIFIVIPFLFVSVLVLSVLYGGNGESIELSKYIKSFHVALAKDEFNCNGQHTGISSIIGVAKFSKDEEDFSDFVTYEIESRLKYDDVKLIGFDDYISPGIVADTKVAELRNANCIDTGMIVHGSRNSDQEMFVCKVHFFNFHRSDTLIKNPSQIEFSYRGHSRYIADFLLAHEYYRRGDYDQAVRLLMSARKQGVDTSFMSLTNYYLGNVYLELGKPSQAQKHFQSALGNTSVQDDARWQIENLVKVRVKESELIEHRRNETADFRSVLKYRLSKMYGVPIDDEDIVRVDADSWVETKSTQYNSVWLFKFEDSLFCYSLVGNLKGPQNYQFIINKDWSLSTKYGGFRCVLRTNYSKPKSKLEKKISLGWSIHFFPKTFKNNFWSSTFVRYSWYYRLCASGKQPYLEDSSGVEHFEAKRWRFVEKQILKFSNHHNLGIAFANDWNSFLKDEDEL